MYFSYLNFTLLFIYIYIYLCLVNNLISRATVKNKEFNNDEEKLSLGVTEMKW